MSALSVQEGLDFIQLNPDFFFFYYLFACVLPRKANSVIDKLFATKYSMNFPHTITSGFDTVTSELLLSFLSLKSISGHYHKLRKKGYKHPCQQCYKSVLPLLPLHSQNETPFLVLLTLSCPQNDHLFDQVQPTSFHQFQSKFTILCRQLNSFSV